MAQLLGQAVGQLIHSGLRENEATPSDIDTNDIDRRVLVGEAVAGAAVRAVPPFDGGRSANEREVRQGTDGRVALSEEAILAVAASKGQSAETRVVVDSVVADFNGGVGSGTLRCRGSSSESRQREGRKNRAEELHVGGCDFFEIVAKGRDAD